MKNDRDRNWELAGYWLWLVGILLFGAAAVVNDDPLSLIASLLFLAGILAVMLPMLRRPRR